MVDSMVDRNRASAIVTTVWCVAFIIAIIIDIILFTKSQSKVPAVLLLAGLVGAAIGWSLGIFLSPFGKEQERYFTPVGVRSQKAVILIHP